MDAQLGLFPDLAPAQHGGRVEPAPPDPDLLELAERLPAGLRLGTSSWSFPGWEGIVYDRQATEATLAREGLRAYARHPLFRTVGIDRTYYRPVAEDVFRAYAADVPADFRFLVKADRRTISPLDPDARDRRTPNPLLFDAAWATDEVVAPAVEGLGRKLGPILFQLPPMDAGAFGGPGRFAERLGAFLGALPAGPSYAVELRTPALLTGGYADALEGARASHGYTVHPAMAPLERQIAVLPPHYQPTLVLRWMLGSGLEYMAARARYEPFDRLVDEDPPTRGAVAVCALDALIAERSAFVVVNNKAEGSAPLTLRRLAQAITADRDAP